MSEVFLSQLDSDIIDQHNVSGVHEGLQAVKNGSCWALVEMGPNFSKDFVER